ncbi:PspC domain-containing protein [Candidatus Litorirhabdus singularis]|nr:PspC domain-containing protein [Candidatus Litorirhabdus singularis]
MNLYRNTRDGKVAGVCAGLADHWEVDHWVVRIAAVMLFLFMGPLAFWAYVAAWMLLAPLRRSNGDDTDAYARSGRRYSANASDGYTGSDDVEVAMDYDENYHTYRPRKMFRYGESPAVRLQRARERLDAALGRVEDMESYVTSRQYNLNKEFSKL